MRISRFLVLCSTAACTSPSASTSTSGTPEVVVAASDYSSSVICGVPGDCRTGVDLGKDPMLAATNGRVFFVARDNDLLFELDPRTAMPTARSSVHVDDARLGNPHDAAAAPDGAVFVVLYNLARIVVLRDGHVKPEETIDLSGAEYDEDGNPQADAIRIVDVGGTAKAFVTLERLDDGDYLRSTRPSRMLRIDVATRKVESILPLAGKNPFNPMSEQGDALFLAEPGNFDAAGEEAAGIERFEIATGATRLVVPEKDLGGSVAEVAVASGCGAAIVAGAEATVNPTSLVTFDPMEGRPSTPVLGPTPGYDLQGLAWRGDVLYVGDRRASDGGYAIHVLERAPGTCIVTDTGRILHVPQRPVALRSSLQAR